VNAREEKHFSISDNEFVNASYSMKKIIEFYRYKFNTYKNKTKEKYLPKLK